MEKFIEIDQQRQLTYQHLAQAGFTAHFDWQSLWGHERIIGRFEQNRLIGLIAFERHIKGNLIILIY